MKKLVALVLAALMLLGAASAFAEQTTLTMWCIATESDANRPGFEAATAAFAANHPDVTLDWSAYENESYKTKIKAAVQADELPDIFFTWSGAFLGDFVDAGRVYCLDDVYPTFAAELPEVMLQNSSYGGHHYAVPLTMNIVTLFANMDLLAEAGYTEIPGTYEELIACCDALVEKGIVPFGCSGKETWCVTEYVEPIIEKTIGYEKLGAIFSLQESWNDPAIATAIDTFQGMVNNGYFDPNGIALGNDEVKANFIAGKYAFYQNGSWNCGEIAAADGNFKCGLFPVMDTEKATLGQVIGGPNDALAVSASSPNVELAAQAAFEIGRDVCKYGYLAGAGLPAWSLEYTEEEQAKVNPLSAAVSEIVANADGMVLFGDNAMSANIANTYLDYVAMVYGCELDGAGFVEGLTADIG